MRMDIYGLTLKISEYLELTKPKVTLLNLLVGVTSFILAGFPSLNLLSLATFILLSYLTVGGCGALNCYLDRDIDKLMSRTSQRSIPSGAIQPIKALLFGASLASVGLLGVYFVFGTLTLTMFSLGVAFYLFVYTIWLKRKTTWNVVIGGVSGGFAAVAGWTATGVALTPMPLLLSLLDFAWTPGHLWSLTMKAVKEYEKAAIPMLPVVFGLKRTAEYVFFFNAATFGLSLLFPLLGLTGLVYLTIVAVAGIKLLVESGRLLGSQSAIQAFKVFMLSMPYLACVMLAMLADKVFLSLPLLLAS
jgi:protoheme IX farnesyltransferase